MTTTGFRLWICTHAAIAFQTAFKKKFFFREYIVEEETILNLMIYVLEKYITIYNLQ